MSSWTYVHGTIVASPPGRTQHEKRYILETVLDHLPVVTGSERDMEVYVIQKRGHNSSSFSDEFLERTNNLRDRFGDRSRKRGSLQMQDEYILVVDAALRDRWFEETFKEFVKWICRLSKRIIVDDVNVKIKGFEKEYVIDNPDPFYNMSDFNNDNWCDYLMWKYDRDEEGNLLGGKPTNREKQ